VRVCHLFRTLQGLQVEHSRLDDQQGRLQVGNFTRQVGPPESGEEFVQSGNVPPAVHIGFAHADAPFAQRPIKEPLVVNLNVPWLGSVYADPRIFQEFGDLSPSRGIAPDSRLYCFSRL
jgi:hypothetical protein